MTPCSKPLIYTRYYSCTIDSTGTGTERSLPVLGLVLMLDLAKSTAGCYYLYVVLGLDLGLVRSTSTGTATAVPVSGVVPKFATRHGHAYTSIAVP